jgi:hypothetical protein
MRWDAFAWTCPEIGERAGERFVRDEVVLLGTLRRDGSPRIRPCEPDMVARNLLLGTMWHSKKVLDLEGDPRLVMHSMVPDREGPLGDIKLYGRAVAIDDHGLRPAFREAMSRRIGWAPRSPGTTCMPSTWSLPGSRCSATSRSRWRGTWSTASGPRSWSRPRSSLHPAFRRGA